MRLVSVFCASLIDCKCIMYGAFRNVLGVKYNKKHLFYCILRLFLYCKKVNLVLVVVY